MTSLRSLMRPFVHSNLSLSCILPFIVFILCCVVLCCACLCVPCVPPWAPCLPIHQAAWTVRSWSSSAVCVCPVRLPLTPQGHLVGTGLWARFISTGALASLCHFAPHSCPSLIPQRLHHLLKRWLYGLELHCTAYGVDLIDVIFRIHSFPSQNRSLFAAQRCQLIFKAQT